MPKTNIEFTRESLPYRRLFRHCWIHAGYPENGYLQMTTKQKRLYCRIIGALFHPLAPIFDVEGERVLLSKLKNKSLSACLND